MRKPVFIVFLVLYLIHLYLKFAHIQVPVFFSSYGADLLCMPIVLSLTQNFVQKIHLNNHFQLTFGMLFVVFLLFSISFEVILPYWSSRYTSDVYDVLCYAVGVCFFVVEKKV